MNILVMKNTLIKIKPATYYFLLLCFLCGIIKNVLVLFMIVIIHEIGHILVIKFFRYEIENITIYPFGGVTIINKLINSSITKDLIVAVSGVIFQYIVIILIIKYIPFKYNTLNMINNYNKVIIIFNLLPIIPLDGSKIVFDLFSYKFSYKLSYLLTFILSIISIILFINYNIVYSINNYLIISILIYYTFKYYKDFKYVFNKFLLERIMYDFKYKKIINNTKKLTQLKKEKLHYFNHINERKIIQSKFDKSSYF